MNRHEEDDRRAREAKAILERVRQETEPQVGAGAHRFLTRTREHFTAADVDQGDRVDVLGTRIGRILGLIGFVVLAVMLAQYLTRG